jgi:addiction module HigA family antidote
MNQTAILNGRKRRPTHPGELIREDILPNLPMSQAELALLAGVSRQTLSQLLAEKRSISIDLAYRLGRLFKMDGATFVRMQEAVDVWDTLQKNRQEYEKIKPVVA